MSIVSTLKVEVLGNHCKIHVWNRGGKAGTLTVDRKDADHFISVLSVADTYVYYRESINAEYRPLFGKLANITTEKEHTNEC